MAARSFRPDLLGALTELLLARLPERVPLGDERLAELAVVEGGAHDPDVVKAGHPAAGSLHQRGAAGAQQTPVEARVQLAARLDREAGLVGQRGPLGLDAL